MRRSLIVGLGMCTALSSVLGLGPGAGGAGPPGADVPAPPATDLRLDGAATEPASLPGGTEPPASGRGTSLSGTLVSGGHTLTYAVGGAATASDAYEGYDAVVKAGGTVTLVGAMTYSIDGGATLLSQSASLTGTDGVTGYSGDYVTDGTYTTPFTLATKAPKVDGKGVVRSIYASVRSRNCNYWGVCGGPTVSVSIGVLGKGTDTKPPTITVVEPDDATREGKKVDVKLRVKDDSKKAKVFAAMFSDGTAVMTGKTSSFIKADGSTQKAWWRYPTGETGPFYECFWAKDKAGNVSEGAPYSTCAWLSIEVPITLVSNGCGGSAWGDQVVAILNWIGDKRTYGKKTVNQRPACNLHDAGYSGATVRKLRSKQLIDYRTMSREEVDQRFASDLASQCRHYLPKKKKALRKECLEESYIYVGLVRQHGLEVYDADATTHGTQTVTPTTTLPPGGGRDNG